MYQKRQNDLYFKLWESIIENVMVGGRTMHSCTEILVHISALQYVEYIYWKRHKLYVD